MMRGLARRRSTWLGEQDAEGDVVAGGKTTVPPAAAVADSMALWIADEPTVPGGSGVPFINNSAPSHPICGHIPGQKNTVIYMTRLRDPYYRTGFCPRYG